MIILIPVLLIVLAIWALKWTIKRTNLTARVYAVAVGAGVGAYGVVGAVFPHTDPNMWHYLSAPAFALATLAIGFMYIQ